MKQYGRKRARYNDNKLFFLRALFYITYENKFSYGCRAMGFKSVRMPSADVFANSEMDCNLFTLKERKKKG
jgi:hypothetical protein